MSLDVLLKKLTIRGKYMKKNIYALLTMVLVINCLSIDQPKITTYLSLAAEFLDLSKPTPSEAEYSLYRSYVKESRGHVLEPMCGTGRYMIPLLEEGFKIEGFDASPFMIKSLQAKCIKKSLCPQVWEQFIELVPTTRKYNLIFIPDTSLCFFSELDHIKKVLQKLYSLLLPRGKLVFDAQTPYARWGQIGIWSGSAYKNSDGNMLVESMLPLKIENSVSPLLLRYELIVGSEIVKTEMELYPARLYTPQQMGDLLKEVGFRKIKKIKAYDRKNKPSFDDVAIVYECTK